MAIGQLLAGARLQQHAEFRDMVQAAVVRIATEVSMEDPNTPLHEARQNLAGTVLRGDAAAVRLLNAWTWIAAADDPIRAAAVNVTTETVNPRLIADAALLALVRGTWDAMTGETPTPLPTA